MIIPSHAYKTLLCKERNCADTKELHSIIYPRREESLKDYSKGCHFPAINRLESVDRACDVNKTIHSYQTVHCMPVYLMVNVLHNPSNPWYSYSIVAQNMLRACVGNQVFFFCC